MSVSLPHNELLRVIELYASVQVAVTTAVLYDHVLAFAREVELIWMKPMTLVTVLYVIERYLGDAVLIIGLCMCFSESASEDEYVSAFVIQGIQLFEVRAWGALAYAWATQATMQLRIYAMYRQSKTILTLLLFMFLCEIAAIAFIIFREIGPSGHIQAANEYAFGTHFCFFSGVSPSFVYIFIPFIIFEFFLFLLAARMFIENMKRNLRAACKEKGFGLNSFMRVLARDSLCYFFVNLVASTIVTTIWLTVNPLYANLSIPFVLLLEVLIGTRLILDFRERYARPDVDPVVSGKQSSLQFREDNTTSTNPSSHMHENQTDLRMNSRHVRVRCHTETIVVSDIVEISTYGEV